MSKTMVPYINKPKRGMPRLKKTMSHGTFRCKRHPNSKRCQNA